VSGRLAIREAIASAIDREAIIQYLLGGAARPAAALLPPDHWAGNPALSGLEFDPERSRALLAAAGYTAGQPLQITYKTSTDPVRVRIATVIQQQLHDVGIDMKLQSFDWGTFYGDIKAGHFQLYTLAWVGIKTPDIFRYAFHSTSLPPEGANRGHLSDPQIDSFIETAEQGTTLAMQAAAYRQVQARLLQQLPYIPLWYEDHVFAARSDISGYRLSYDGNYDALCDVSRSR
jgi:peptide/nickel transport system substrate-binding protein